jgi:hypothetical protein
MNVRDSTQISRNDTQLELLQEAWCDKVSIRSWVFALRQASAPLSWQLSNEERTLIEGGWTDEHEKDAAELDAWLRPQRPN